jgi:hypothetical protein
MGYIFWYDWVISFFLIIILFICSFRFVRKNQDDHLIKTYFIRGIGLKILGSVAFAVYHAYIYGGGDTFGYFMTGKTITQTFFNSPSNFFNLTFYSLENNTALASSIDWLWDESIMYTMEANYFSARIAAVLQLFTFQSYMPTCILFSLLSFWGIWKCFKFFNLLFVNNEKAIAIGFLYFPTIVFWGSGLGKDSITLGAVCGLVVCAFHIFITKERIFKNIIGLIFMLVTLFILKPYVPLAFLMPLILAISFSYIARKSTSAKFFIIPLILSLLVGAFFLLNDIIENNFTEFSSDTITDKIVSSNKNLQAAGSAFDLGIRPENINSMGDMAPFFPKAIIATWYRPWLWEAKNPAMLLSALEGCFLLIVSIVIIFKGIIFRPIGIIIRNPILFSLFIYCVIFSGLIGLSTSNFGTLVRYKLPCMPFLVTVLLVTLKKLKTKEISL